MRFSAGRVDLERLAQTRDGGASLTERRETEAELLEKQRAFGFGE